MRRELIEGRLPEVEELNRIVQAWSPWSKEMIFCVVQCHFCGAAVSELEIFLSIKYIQILCTLVTAP